MKLIKLSLQDFQGLRTYTLNADGQNISVYGTNGSGKTTIANALTWLLFDKPYTGEKGYSPKTTDEDGQELHHLDHRAEAVFEKDDGSRITIAKSFHEVWKKKRGSNVEEFSGHVTDAYIDGVPVSTSEYKRTMEEICAPDWAKILTDPRYFAKTMHWEERRAILLDMCGDVTDAEVIAAAPDLADLWNFLRKPGTGDQYYTVGEFQRIAASRKAELNRDLTILPARIDEAMKSIPDTADLPPEDTLDASIRDLEQQKTSLMTQAAALTEDDRLQEIRREIGEVEIKIARARVAYMDALDMQNRTAQAEVNEIQQAIHQADLDIASADSRIYILTAQIQTMTKDREDLLRRHADVKSRVWEGDTICAACGQPLPEDKIEEARAKFNQERSRELAEINEQGSLCSKTAIEEKQAELDKVTQFKADAEARKEQLTPQLEEAKKAIQVSQFEATDQYADLAAQRGRLTVQLTEGSTNTLDEQKAAIKAQIAALDDDLRRAQEARITYATARKRRERLVELEAQEKDLAREYEKFDRGVFLCEEFTRQKVTMLDERINSRFTAVRFRLFKTQINGGLQDCCDVLCPTSRGLTPYDSANNAACIRAGIEIISALSEHWGITMPILIDNAESVVGDIKASAQVIRLIVSEDDEKLRVEKEVA